MIKYILNHLIRLNYLIKVRKCAIHPKAIVYRGCDLGINTSIGKNSIVGNSRIGSYSYVSSSCFINNTLLGKFCSIGPNVKMGLGNHPTNTFVSTSPFFYMPKVLKFNGFVKKVVFHSHKAIEVGNDVWIGANVVVMDGVKIGDGAILAAGAIVTKDVAPYAIVGGVPAKEIKKRFTSKEQEKLLTLKWWDKDIRWLQSNAEKFQDVNKIINIK